MLLDDFQSLSAIAVTPAGVQCLYALCQSAQIPLWGSVTLQASLPPAYAAIQTYPDSLRSHVAAEWKNRQGFIFCLSTGAVVRLIAPLLTDKATDPAIVVVDAAGQVVISLCGGHQGGADQLAQWVASQLQAQVILTGAANEQRYPAIDTIGAPFGWQLGTGNWTGVSAIAAKGGAIEVIQEAGSTLWMQHLPTPHPFQFAASPSPVDSPDSTLAPGSPPETEPPQARLWISPVQRRFDPTATFAKAQWHPRVLWVGIGCERHTATRLIEQAIQSACRSAHLAEAAIAGVASLDLKADEPGLVELCAARGWPLRTFTAAELASIPVPHPSPTVQEAVGTPSVAEAAAIAAAQAQSGLAIATTIAAMDVTSTNVTSTPYPPLRVEKQIVRDPDQPGAVTVAIAIAEREWTGRSGHLYLVGTGPGAINQITPAAQAAIRQADVVIGYTLYLDLVRSLFRPGQIIEGRPITEERQRAARAIHLATWGLTIAVISSGDAGIYGMAGLVMELLQAQSWDGQTPAVTVYPGISALQAAAARVGAPLMHDFCAISLSDLLTPWAVIQQRLAAAAAADFVIALYNPKSQTRTTQIATAQDILLQHRDPHTPVALVRSVYRPDEQITLTTIAEFLHHPVDMLTVVLIGNRSTQRHHDWLITPRGYLGNDPSRHHPATNSGG